MYSGNRPEFLRGIYHVESLHVSADKKVAQVQGFEEAAQAPSRRSPFEVRMDVLKVTSSGPTKRTHIMYRSNTSWVVLKKNLEDLLAGGFVRQSGEGSKVEYSITDRGLSVLHDYQDVMNRASRSRAEVRS